VCAVCVGEAHTYMQIYTMVDCGRVLCEMKAVVRCVRVLLCTVCVGESHTFIQIHTSVDYRRVLREMPGGGYLRAGTGVCACALVSHTDTYTLLRMYVD